MTQPPKMSKEASLEKLKALLGFTAPYRRPLIFAIFSLIIAAGMVLSLGGGLRHLIDRGFVKKIP